MPPVSLALEDHSVIDISHESLIRRWGQLVEWAKQERQWRTTYRAVESEALSEFPEHWKGAKLEAALDDRRAFALRAMHDAA